MNMHMLEKCIVVRKEIKSKGYIPEGFRTFEITESCSIIYLKIRDNTIIAEPDIPDGYHLVYQVNYDGAKSEFYHSIASNLFLEKNYTSFFGMIFIGEKEKRTMPMYMDRLGNIFSISPNGNKSFDEACFQVDTLMTPIISVLLKKGYKTRACCSGHVSTVYCPNYDDCIDDPEIKYETEKNFSIDKPYIMFEDDIKVPLNGLPKSWEWEYAIPRSANIISEEEFRKAKYFTFKVGDIIPVYSNAKNGFNLSIRPSFEYYGFHLENWYDLYKNDPFMFYKKLVNALHELYLWAAELPVYQAEEHKRGFFKSK